MDRVHQMVTQLMAVPPNDATQGEVIIAFGKAVALMAYMIGHHSKGEYPADEVLDDVIDCIQHSYDNQTVIVSEYHEH
jgi:CRISPR/Cas system CSM-associated protein Csm2 small subunit